MYVLLTGCNAGVQGGIGSVGGYISNYGNTIQRSMSADGPVSSAPKKTAVKPSTPQPAQKAVGSTQNARKALPPSAGPRKAPSTKPATPQKALPSTKPAQNSRVGGPTPVRSQGPGVSKPGSNPPKSAQYPQKTASKVNTSGKVVPSAASRPGYKKPAATKGASTAGKSGDILGIGDNFADTSKTRPKSTQAKISSRKPSASDPLAIGDDIASIGKKK